MACAGSFADHCEHEAYPLYYPTRDGFSTNDTRTILRHNTSHKVTTTYDVISKSYFSDKELPEHNAIELCFWQILPTKNFKENFLRSVNKRLTYIETKRLLRMKKVADAYMETTRTMSPDEDENPTQGRDNNLARIAALEKEIKSLRQALPSSDSEDDNTPLALRQRRTKKAMSASPLRANRPNGNSRLSETHASDRNTGASRGDVHTRLHTYPSSSLPPPKRDGPPRTEVRLQRKDTSPPRRSNRSPPRSRFQRTEITGSRTHRSTHNTSGERGPPTLAPSTRRQDNRPNDTQTTRTRSPTDELYLDTDIEFDHAEAIRPPTSPGRTTRSGENPPLYKKRRN